MDTSFAWGTNTQLSTVDVIVDTSVPTETTVPTLTTLDVDFGSSTASEDGLIWPPEAPSTAEPTTTGHEITISSSPEPSDNTSHSSARATTNSSPSNNSTGAGPTSTSEEPDAAISSTHGCPTVARSFLVAVGVVYVMLFILAP